MNTSVVARQCPKCGHQREPAAAVPDWQCPACGIAYHKYEAWLARNASPLRPPQAGDAVPPALLDGSVLALVASNVIAVGLALGQQHGLEALMLVFWAQSVIIGLSNVVRMLSLERFSTDGLTMNGKAVEPVPATKRQVAGFFLIHYGIFHAVYFVFLVVEGDAGAVVDTWFWVCVAVFAVNHAWSLRYNRALDAAGCPNIGTLMFTPYLRIIPMHLVLILGKLLPGSMPSLLLFGLLKTGADVGMHLVEHQRLRKVAGARPTSP